MSIDELGFAVRLLAAIVWTGVFWRTLRGDHWTRLEQYIVAGTIAAVAWALVLRGASILHLLPDSLTAPIVTAVVFAAFVSGLLLLTRDVDS